MTMRLSEEEKERRKLEREALKNGRGTETAGGSDNTNGRNNDNTSAGGNATSGGTETAGGNDTSTSAGLKSNSSAIGSPSSNLDGTNNGDQGNAVESHVSSNTAGSTTGKNILVEKPDNGLKPKVVKPTGSKLKAAGSSKKSISGDISDPETLNVVLQTGFTVLANITGRKHWIINEEEAAAIATPAAGMLADLPSATKKKMGKLANPILLVTACASVILPRIMIDLTIAKTERIRAQYEYQQRIKNQNNRTSGGSLEADTKQSGTNEHGETSVNDESAVKTISANASREIAGILNGGN